MVNETHSNSRSLSFCAILGSNALAAIGPAALWRYKPNALMFDPDRQECSLGTVPFEFLTGQGSYVPIGGESRSVYLLASCKQVRGKTLIFLS